jgi:hypothetical protein
MSKGGPAVPLDWTVSCLVGRALRGGTTDMLSTADHLDLAPPRTGRWLGPVGLALGVHAVLIVALTWGVNWKPRPNLRFRPELRYDWAQGGVQPFDGGRADDQRSETAMEDRKRQGYF